MPSCGNCKTSEHVYEVKIGDPQGGYVIVYMCRKCGTKL